MRISNSCVASASCGMLTQTHRPRCKAYVMPSLQHNCPYHPNPGRLHTPTDCMSRSLYCLTGHRQGTWKTYACALLQMRLHWRALINISLAGPMQARTLPTAKLPKRRYIPILRSAPSRACASAKLLKPACGTGTLLRLRVWPNSYASYPRPLISQSSLTRNLYVSTLSFGTENFVIVPIISRAKTAFLETYSHLYCYKTARRLTCRSASGSVSEILGVAP